MSSNYEIDEIDEEGFGEVVETVIAVPMKFAGIIVVKTVKDVINYPPMMLDDVLRARQQTDTGDELPKTNPGVMLAKLLGVLIFKTLHDVTYFPMVWTKRFVECQSLDECEI